MGAIKLDILQETGASKDNSQVYTDLHVDLILSKTYQNELNKKLQITDVLSDNNAGAIKNSIVNILSTRPGEKLLNPLFGCSFGDLLFLPVMDSRARLIGQSILTSITRFEPRIKVINIDVTPFEDEGEYVIEFTLQVPRFDSVQIKFKGTLQKAGFYMA